LSGGEERPSSTWRPARASTLQSARALLWAWLLANWQVPWRDPWKHVS